MGERGKDRWDADVRGVGGYESRKAETVGKRGSSYIDFYKVRGSQSFPFMCKK